MIKVDLKNTGERLFPDTPGSLENLDIRHTQRYQWASMFTHGKYIYDLACGVGYGSLLLEAGRYIGFDNSAETIKYAAKYYAPNPSISYLQADACAMPDNLETADVIVSFETIEHLANPEALLSWSAAHAKLMLISSPIRNSFRRSRFHLFEYKLAEFDHALNKYFSKVTMFVQKADLGIIFPCLPEDKGVAVAVCLP